MSALASAFSGERYELKESANIRENPRPCFHELTEYNTIAHVYNFFFKVDNFLIIILN